MERSEAAVSLLISHFGVPAEVVDRMTPEDMHTVLNHAWFIYNKGFYHGEKAAVRDLIENGGA